MLSRKPLPRTIFLWIGVFVLSFLIGLQEANSVPVPPNCIWCDCKQVAQWRDFQGTSRGAVVADTATPTVQAIVSIFSDQGCKFLPRNDDGTNLVDYWSLDGGNPVCTTGANLVEISGATLRSATGGRDPKRLCALVPVPPGPGGGN